MFCSKCGAENSDDTKFCGKCGQQVGEAVVEDVQQTSNVGSDSPTIWNPNAAVNWSLLFTPAFGSFIQWKNWVSLNEPEKAKSSMVWFIISILMVFAIVIAVDEEFAAPVAFLLLIVWYFLSGRKQGVYIKSKYGDGYTKKGWLKPILIAFLVLVAMAIIGGPSMKP